MIGQTVSHYKILEKLGEGGMGVVYKAEDTKLKRPVALKFLPPGLTRNPEAKERFLHEARAAAALEHPHICNVHEIDEMDAQMFIVMSCFEGQTLKDKIDAGPLKIDEAVTIALQAAEGLQAAHEAGVVHRDVKSANIMITAKGHTKIMDFGLAKLKGQTRITKEGSTLGTPAYMSPEQARGAETDHRTDIWSLGVVLYEMITGQSPFQGDYEQAVIYSILNETPEPPTALRTGVPIELERIVNKTLTKAPAQRYQHAGDLTVDLRTLTSTSGPGDSAGETKEQSIVVLPFVNMSPDPDQEYFSDGLTEEIITDLSHIHDLRVISRTSAMMLKGTKKELKTIGRELSVRYVLEGSVRKAGNNLRITAQLIDAHTDTNLWAEKYSGTLDDVFDIQEKVSRSIVNALKIKLSPRETKQIAEKPINNAFAFECYLKAKQEIFRYTEASLDRAVQLLRNGLEVVGDNVHLYAGLGYVYYQYVNVGFKPEPDIAKIEEYIQKIFELEPDSPQGHFLLGLINQAFKGNQKKSVHHLKRAFEENPNDSEVLIWLSFAYMLVGKTPAARDLSERLMRISPLSSISHFIVSLIHYYEGDFASVAASIEPCLRREPENVVNLFFCALYYACGRRYDDAVSIIDKMIKTAPEHIWTHFGMFLKYAAQGRKKEMQALETEAFKKYAGRDPSFSGYLASFYSLSGLKDEALVWLENAVNKGLINYPFLAEYDPLLENIRGERRFKELMKRVKHEWENFEG